MKSLSDCAASRPVAWSFRRLQLAFPRVPLAMPYWSRETYRAILRSILSASVIEGPDLFDLKTLLSEAPGLKEVVLCSCGSLALELALRACGVGRGDEVVLPTFCCTTVIAPILAAGGLPVLADCDDNLNLSAAAVEAVLSNKTRAVLVPHLFGNPADIAAIVDLLRGRNIRVIDDAAQALGATIGGRAVGSFGDAGVLSFGCEKICSGLGGGAVVSGDKEVLEGISKIHLPPPTILDSLRSLASTMLWRRWRRWTLPLLTALPDVRSKGPDAPPDEYKKEGMANLKAAVALTLLRRLNENVQARRDRVRAYQELLGSERRLKLVPHAPGSACLTQVVRVLPAHGDHDVSTRLIEALAREGYEAQGSYVPIHLIPAYESYARKGLPNAERIWPDLIELPCEPDVSLDEVERIAGIIRRELKLVRNAN
jgi:dTDP-4-amino-4,6-dideoxygalactose transaminase